LWLLFQRFLVEWVFNNLLACNGLRSASIGKKRFGGPAGNAILYWL